MGRIAIALTWTALALIWGSTWMAIKVGLHDLPPLTFAGIRFAVALPPLLLLMAAKRWPWPRRAEEWRLLTLTGLLTVTGGYGLVYWGEKFIPSGLAAILFSIYPLAGLLFANALLPSEPMTRRKLTGVFLGLAGVAVLFMDRLAFGGPMALWGSLALVASTLCGSLSGVLIKREGGHLDPVAVSVVQMAVGGLPLLVFGMLLEGNPLKAAWTPKAVGALLYLSLAGTSLAFVLWYRLIRAVEVTRAQMMPLLNTLVAVLLGKLLMGETYGVRGLIGGAAIFLGLALSLGGSRGSAALAPGRPGR